MNHEMEIQIRHIIGFILVYGAFCLQMWGGSNEKQFQNRVIISLLGLSLLH